MTKPTAFIINQRSWENAVLLAIRAGQLYGAKQRCYRHPIFGWTWERAS